MRRRLRMAAAGALALAALPAGSAALGATHAARAAVAVGVAQTEFRIDAYRRVLTPGRVRLNVENFGQDTHNLVVVGPGGYRVKGPDLAPGQRDTVTANLRRPGVYLLICTRANHEKLGMKTRITVRRAAAR